MPQGQIFGSPSSLEKPSSLVALVSTRPPMSAVHPCHMYPHLVHLPIGYRFTLILVQCYSFITTIALHSQRTLGCCATHGHLWPLAAYMSRLSAMTFKLDTIRNNPKLVTCRIPSNPHTGFEGLFTIQKCIRTTESPKICPTSPWCH
jgi:hypothetical protein